MHFEYIDEFLTKDCRIWFQRLGAEALAGAIADMLWKSQRRTNYGRLFGTTWLNKFAWIFGYLVHLNFFGYLTLWPLGTPPFYPLQFNPVCQLLRVKLWFKVMFVVEYVLVLNTWFQNLVSTTGSVLNLERKKWNGQINWRRPGNRVKGQFSVNWTQVFCIKRETVTHNVPPN